MTYSAPTTKSTGTLITAAIWNQDVVDNQNAAFPVGVAGWTSWTPTWANLTVGDGTVVAKYVRIGRTVHWRLRFMFGTTSAVGSAPTFTLPVTPSADYVAAAQGTLIGQATFRDVGTADNSGVVVHTSSGVGRPVVHTASGAYVAAADLTSTVPFTWAQFDTIFCFGTYEAAT